MAWHPQPPTVNLQVYLKKLGVWAMYLDDSIAKLRGFEGSIQWMYLDTVGVVTVGVGRALFKLSDALALPFGANGRKATVYEITAEYNRVKAMEKGKAAAFYRSATSPVLDQGTIDAMLAAKVDEFDHALRAKVAGYATAPDQVKVALLDMAYNLGVGGLLAYTHLCGAVAKADWAACVALCHRRGPSEARNSWTSGMFAAAAAVVSAARTTVEKVTIH